VFFATTAPRIAAAGQVRHLEATSGVRVVGWSARLADREGLAEDLDAAAEYDVLLTELKAAAVDVACERAVARGAEVVFVDNRPEVAGADAGADLGSALTELIDLAVARGIDRGAAEGTEG